MALRKLCTAKKASMRVRMISMKREGKTIKIIPPICAPASVVGIMIETRS